MTLRRSFHISILATALLAGAVALPSTAQAAPSVQARSSMRVSVTALGDDPWGVTAAKALDVWNEYRLSGDRKALAEFEGIRNSIAAEAARRVEADPARMQAAWDAADTTHQLVLMAAFTQLGTPYRNRGRAAGEGFDCSGLTSWAWAQVGVQIERVSRDQIRSVAPVDRTTAQAGDLIYYPGHVSLYLGVDDFIIHSPFTGRDVEVSHISKRHSRSAKLGNPIGG
jgi:cell wall-associated NlpC family hydrolase